MPSRGAELITGLAVGILRCAVRALDASVSILLNLVLAKPISIFVWWLHAWANHTTFHGRSELARRVKRARRAGDPVLFASNHLSMFDDPVIPMALFRTGPRAAAELSGFAALLLLWRVTPPTIASSEVLVASLIAYALAIALLGARKTWWSIGDLVNFSGASALRGKMESGRDRPLSLPARLLLDVADPVVFFFMRSATVKTVLVDRRPGEEGKRSRIRAAERGIELAAEGEQIWIFFEGGRSRHTRRDQAGAGRDRSSGRRAPGPWDSPRGHCHPPPRTRACDSHLLPPLAHVRPPDRRSLVRVRSGGKGGPRDHRTGEPRRSRIEIRAAVVRLQSDWRSERSTDG